MTKTAIIPAKDVGTVMWNMLLDVVDEEYEGETEEVKEEAKARILEALSMSMFR